MALVGGLRYELSVTGSNQAISSKGRSCRTTGSKIFLSVFYWYGQDSNEAWCRSCQSLDHATSNCPMAPQRKLQRKEVEREAPCPKTPEICRNYDTKGCNYTKCHRCHVCLHAGAKNPQSRCPHLKINKKS